jgi:hypothetical protein
LVGVNVRVVRDLFDQRAQFGLSAVEIYLEFFALDHTMGSLSANALACAAYLLQRVGLIGAVDCSRTPLADASG